MFYIVGLGNPGKKYAGTRHNVGRDVLFHMQDAGQFNDWNKSKHANAQYSRGVVGDCPVELLIPETFMNKSGDTARYVVQKHDATPGEFIVVYDDVDVPIGEFKISVGRGAGGHNGIASMIAGVGSKDFVRIRVGVSGKSFWTGATKRPAAGRMSSYVLGKFNRRESAALEATVPEIVSAIETVVADGVAKAMNRFNGK